MHSSQISKIKEELYKRPDLIYKTRPIKPIRLTLFGKVSEAKAYKSINHKSISKKKGQPGVPTVAQQAKDPVSLQSSLTLSLEQWV